MCKPSCLTLKVISSQDCAVLGFVLIFLKNLLMCYPSVIVYMKFFSPPSHVVLFRNVDELKCQFGIMLRFFYSSLFCKYKYITMKKKIMFCPKYCYIGKYKHSFMQSSHACKQLQVKIVQFGLKIIFNPSPLSLDWMSLN